MGNRIPGPKSAVFNSSLSAHTLINAAFSLLAQSSLAQLYLSRVESLQRPFPVTQVLLVHSVPASQKLSTIIYRAWLSNLAQPHSPALPAQPSPGAVAHTAPDPPQGPAQPGNFPAHIPMPAPWEGHRTERNFLVCECSAHSRLECVTMNLS